MPLPAAWVDALFARLSLRHGAAFMRQYEGLDPELVKRDWADVLSGFAARPHAIAYALDHLPPDRPVNALQFRALARLAPEPPQPALARPKPDPERLRDALARLKATRACVATRPPASHNMPRSRDREPHGTQVSTDQKKTPTGPQIASPSVEQSSQQSLT